MPSRFDPHRDPWEADWTFDDLVALEAGNFSEELLRHLHTDQVLALTGLLVKRKDWESASPEGRKLFGQGLYARLALNGAIEAALTATDREREAGRRLVKAIVKVCRKEERNPVGLDRLVTRRFLLKHCASVRPSLEKLVEAAILELRRGANDDAVVSRLAREINALLGRPWVHSPVPQAMFARLVSRRSARRVVTEVLAHAYPIAEQDVERGVPRIRLR